MRVIISLGPTHDRGGLHSLFVPPGLTSLRLVLAAPQQGGDVASGPAPLSMAPAIDPGSINEMSLPTKLIRPWSCRIL